MGFFDTNKFDIDDNTDTVISFSGDVKDATVNDPSLKFGKARYKRGNFHVPSYRNVEFSGSEYDLDTIANAVQLDGILSRAVKLFTEQIMKNGYDVVIPNDTLYKHVNNRIKEIELFTNLTTNELLTTVAKQLVTYGNAYLIKVRKANVSKFGKSYELYNKRMNPIVGLFLADATTMEIGVDDRTQVKYYKQKIRGEEKIFKKDDVIHFTYDKIPGLLTGRSSIVPILDDVRALRKLEEEAEILGFQYSVPLYLYKVGSDQHPASPNEIDSVTAEINHMNTYGIMVVPWTHNVETVTNDNDPIGIIDYVKHFKQRVFTGLGVSPSAMGESDSANRNTAEASYISMQSTTKSYQQIISNKIDMELIKELILDAGYNPIRFEYNLRFPEIDLEATIKHETHVIQKFHANLITRDESRVEMGLEAKMPDATSYLNTVQIPLIKAEADAQLPIMEKQGEIDIKVSKAMPKPVAGSSAAATKKPSGTKANKTKKASENKNKANSRPTNQHGTSTGRPVFKKDDVGNCMNYVANLSDVLLDRGEYKSKMNRNKFMDKAMDSVKSTILKVVESNDSLDYDTLVDRYTLRIKDRLDRLEFIDSDIKFEYITKSILDEIQTLDLLMEIDNGEE